MRGCGSRGVVLCALAALVHVAPPATARGAAEGDRWVEARSPHVVIVSSAGEEQARRLAGQLERVRAMLQRALPDARVDPRKPVVVLAVGREHGVRELLPQFWERKGQRPVAAYWGGPQRHCIVLRVDAPERELYRRILHEYVHLLAHENVPDLPAWLDEGLSEFWGTAVVEDDALEVGRPAPHHLRLLRRRREWIPLDALLAMERVLDARDGQRLALFYAQSWALTHYLLLGGSRAALELAPSEYVEQLREQEDPVEAAKLAFGSLAELERAMADYVRGARFRTVRIEINTVTQVRLKPDTTYDSEVGLKPDTTYVRSLSLAQSLAVRAGCLADGERPAAALPLLTRALAVDPNETSVLETFGYFHFQQNNPDEAAGWFDRAIASGTGSHLAYFYRAILMGPVPSLVRLKPDTTYDAEDLLRRAIDLDPAFAPAYARLADVYARQSDRLEDALPLLQRATELEPENAAYWVERGKLLIRLNRPGEAREAGERGLAAARSARSRGLLQAFLRDVTS